MTVCGAPDWRGTGTVVDGNGAADQPQLGVYADVFDLVRLYIREPRREA